MRLPESTLAAIEDAAYGGVAHTVDVVRPVAEVRELRVVLELYENPSLTRIPENVASKIRRTLYEEGSISSPDPNPLTPIVDDLNHKLPVAYNRIAELTIRTLEESRCSMDDQSTPPTPRSRSDEFVDALTRHAGEGAAALRRDPTIHSTRMSYAHGKLGVTLTDALAFLVVTLWRDKVAWTADVLRAERQRNHPPVVYHYPTPPDVDLAAVRAEVKRFHATPQTMHPTEFGPDATVYPAGYASGDGAPVVGDVAHYDHTTNTLVPSDDDTGEYAPLPKVCKACWDGGNPTDQGCKVCGGTGLEPAPPLLPKNPDADAPVVVEK